jgi:hypothetical protein
MDLGRRLKHAFGVTGKVASCVKTVKRKGREDSAKVRRKTLANLSPALRTLRFSVLSPTRPWSFSWLNVKNS